MRTAGLIWQVALSLIGGGVSLAHAVDLDFDTLIEKYRAAVSLPLCISIDAHENVLVSYTTSEQTAREQFVYRLLLRVDQETVYGQKEIFDLNPAGVAVLRQSAKALVTSELSISYQLEAGRQTGLAWTSSDPAEARDKAIWMGTVSGRVLDGFLTCDGYRNPIADLLKTGSNQQVRTEQISGSVRCAILSAETKFGRHVLWLNPDNHFLPVRIEVKKSGQDILYGAPLADGGVATFSLVVDSFQYKVVDDRTFAVAARVWETTNYANGAVKEIISECRRDKIDLRAQNREHEVVMNIPDGTAVSVDPPQGLQYEWRGGRIVPAIDAETVLSIDGAVKAIDPFPRRRIDRWSGWFIAFLVCLAVAMVAGAIALFRKRRAIADLK